MKKILIILLVLCMLIPVKVNGEEEKTIDLHLFYLSTCPHCHAEMEYLEDLEKEYNLKIYKYETSDRKNYDLFVKVQEIIDEVKPGVPYTVIGNQHIRGFGNNAKLSIEKIIDAYIKGNYRDVVSGIINGTITKENYEEIKKELEVTTDNEVDIPLLGRVDAKNISIPLVAIVMGIVDGFNPCAMWVLLFLITMLINMKDRKKMFALGLTFIMTSGLVYAGIMVAWLNIVVSITEVNWIRSCIGIFAVLAGLYNINNYRKEKNKESGCEIVDDKKRKKTIKQIKKFTTEKKFWLAILGVITLAISVNLVELACSAGLPLLFTQILALNNLSDTAVTLSIILYIIFFLIDDIIIFTIATMTFKVTGVTTKYSKWSHLIGGLIMLLMGLLLVFKPEWIMLNF